MNLQHIFISRPPTEIGSVLIAYLKQSGHVIAQSLIKFEKVSVENHGATDVIFFSSIRCAEFYLSQVEKPKSVFACAGSETAQKLLKQFGITCDFISDQPGNPKNALNSFRNWLGKRTVLFPKSQQSLNTFSSAIDANQRKELIVYKTIMVPVIINPCDLYIFSSPSNARSFLKKNAIPREAFCIAWGKSTEEFLISRNQKVDHVLQTGSTQELDAYLNEKFLFVHAR